ncbi:MAG: signal peptidase I [Planctomycetia bacterium]|jgi:signal peptidase I
MGDRTDARQKRGDTVVAGQRAKPASAPERAADWNPLSGLRETVESIVVAFTLALLFRGFEAEAFVIPTGSMAPTLMGRHKDLVCAACGRDFRVGCSAEFDEREQRVDPLRMLEQARCPGCGNAMRLAEGEGRQRVADDRYPSFNGDRILVDKFAYDFAEPERWDVAVFKYPEDAKTNYIKRLVGLPGETLSISGGDLWVARDGGPALIARKPAERLPRLLQLVHDSRHVAEELRQADWPLPWCDWKAAGDPRAAGWQTDDGGRSFAVACAPGAAATLRYRHMVPDDSQWDAARNGKSLAGLARPTVIGDLQPYNADSRGPHYVGDLGIEVAIESRAAAGALVLDLVEAGVAHRCELDLTDGTVRLWRGGVQEDPARGSTTVRGRGRWTLLFTNVDDELRLFVGGRPVAFDRPTAWQRPLETASQNAPVVRSGTPGEQEADDLAPVGLTAIGADVAVGSLRVLRDVYYIASGDANAMAGRIAEKPMFTFPPLAAGQFLMLGDNSSASKDSRAWGHPEDGPFHVDRKLLIGRALVIFWPHAIPASWSVPVNLRGWEVRLPCWPNFGRMGFVR